VLLLLLLDFVWCGIIMAYRMPHMPHMPHNNQMGAESLSKNSKMFNNFVLLTAIINMGAMATTLTAPTCVNGSPSMEGLTCDGSKVIGIDFGMRGLTGNLKALAGLTELTSL
jgi:hypothetical protein